MVSPHTAEGWGFAGHLFLCNICELQWRGKSKSPGLSMGFWFWERICSKSMSCCKESHPTLLTPLHFSCIYTGKINSYISISRYLYISLLPRLPPATILWAGGSVPVRSQEAANLLCLCAATSACPGLPHCLWAAACSLLVWPVSSPHSQLPYHSLFVFFIFWITLFSWVCCLTAWSALSLSALVIPSINHSTTTSTAINLLPVFQIKIHFSLSYVNTSNKHRLNVFHF